MRTRLEIDAEQLLPGVEVLLRRMGLPRKTLLPERYRPSLETAKGLYLKSCRAVGVYGSISVEDFGAIYHGQGLNASDTPLQGIYPRASHLALFAVTLGPAFEPLLEQLFDTNEGPVAYMLDLFASEAADRAVKVLADDFHRKHVSDAGRGVLAYSPGYCGWHITGQHRLFAALKPEEVGIRLLSSSLMSPLKSASGVLIAGERAIHRFRDSFSFCDTCSTRSCRARIASLRPGRKQEDVDGSTSSDGERPGEGRG